MSNHQSEKHGNAPAQTPHYAVFCDKKAENIYLVIPSTNDWGHCRSEHRIDHATALRLRNELNNALFGISPEMKIKTGP